MRHIYLSPHLDDAVFSCGGNIWEQAGAGQGVEVWTVCAGEPAGEGFSAFAESLHARWGLDGRAAVRKRRAEDRRACETLGARPRHFDIPDCIYREGAAGGFLYDGEEAIFGRLAVEEETLTEELAETLRGWLEEGDRLCCPLAVGGHVDHRLTRRAAERLGRPLVYYADVPYALRAEGDAARFAPKGAMPVEVHLPAEAIDAWVEACGAYASQVSSFWADGDALRRELEEYVRRGGPRLWVDASARN